jgi:hypothetical protein
LENRGQEETLALSEFSAPQPPWEAPAARGGSASAEAPAYGQNLTHGSQIDGSESTWTLGISAPDVAFATNVIEPQSEFFDTIRELPSFSRVPDDRL